MSRLLPSLLFIAFVAQLGVAAAQADVMTWRTFFIDVAIVTAVVASLAAAALFWPIGLT